MTLFWTIYAIAASLTLIIVFAYDVYMHGWDREDVFSTIIIASILVALLWWIIWPIAILLSMRR